MRLVENHLRLGLKECKLMCHSLSLCQMAPDGAAVAFTRARHSVLFDASRVAAVPLRRVKVKDADARCLLLTGRKAISC